jgi:hypothetical protein
MEQILVLRALCGVLLGFYGKAAQQESVQFTARDLAKNAPGS